MKLFQLRRSVDHSGVSGTGIVAEGVEFDNGQIALQWIVPEMPSSIAIWEDLEDIVKVHGHGGDTEVVWIAR